MRSCTKFLLNVIDRKIKTVKYTIRALRTSHCACGNRLGRRALLIAKDSSTSLNGRYFIFANTGKMFSVRDLGQTFFGMYMKQSAWNRLSILENRASACSKVSRNSRCGSLIGLMSFEIPGYPSLNKWECGTDQINQANRRKLTGGSVKCRSNG